MSTPARDAEGTARRRVFLFVNGILTRPGSADGWTDRAVTWTHLHTEARGEKFEYAAGVVTRLIHQQARAEKFARMIGYYLGARGNSPFQGESGARGNSPFQWEINLVGHSNGCDIILRALRRMWDGRRASFEDERISAVHLIAAACEGDFEKNGLNDFLEAKFIDRVQVHVGDADRAMSLAQLSKFSPFRFLRFGDLGRTGPVNARFIRPGCVMTHREPFDHSTWFEKGQFDRTMELVTGGNIQAPSTKHQIISKDQAPSTGEVPRSNLQKKESRAVADHTPETYRAGSCTAAARALTETWKGKS